MPRPRFVSPQTEILTLENGNTLIVRRSLNVGERDDAYTACRERIDHDDDRPPAFYFDPTKLAKAKVAAYLVDWQFPDAPPIRDLDLAGRIAVLKHLYPDEFDEMKAAIDRHEATQFAARLEEKKRDQTTSADPISPSPSAAAGVSSGSAS